MTTASLVPFEDLIARLEASGRNGKYITQRQGNILYKAWHADTGRAVQSKTQNGSKFIDTYLSDGRHWKLMHLAGNKVWYFVVEVERAVSEQSTCWTCARNPCACCDVCGVLPCVCAAGEYI